MNVALADRLDAGDHAKQRRLPAAGLAEQGAKLTAFYLEVELLQHLG
jgi:hypothetical protein